ncbi:MAG: hypothetical protein II088_03700, partial [Bacteroidales bacterium]|nr:hypothetical protein [Bacteroidales bacterium]
NTQYYTIQIGNQTWMAQNLKFDGVTAGSDTSSFVAYRYNPDDFDGYVEDYGYLYNWTAILNGGNSSTENPSGVQGICPNGWHLPSDAEWTQLTTYLGGGDEVAAMLSGHPASEGQYWEITDMTESVNFGKSGFNAMPTGVYYAGYYEFGKQTAFWSVTESDDIHIYSRYIMGYGEGSISRSENEGPNGYAVRCVKGTAVYAYDTINQCMEQPYSYTYHDTVITTDGDYTIREQIDSDTENIYKLHIAFHPTLTATVSEFSNGCFGANNGYVEVGATGGAGNYSYAWSTPEMQTSNRLENLAAGEYAVTVTDVGGCTASVSQTIVTTGQLTVTISGDNQICEGDNASLTATAEGGTPDYSYAWTNGATNESTNVQTAGTYAVTVTDDASCTATAAIVVTVNPAATLELTSGQQNQTLCYGTNFTTTVFTYGGGANGVDVTGLPNGVSFTTDATNHTVEISGTPTEAGSYTYMVTTTGVTSPCTNMTITGTITVQMQLTATISGNNPDCYGDETTLTASLAEGTPNTYAWSSGETSASITVSPTTTTTYTVTITDANGCTVTASKNVVVNSQLTVSISGDTQVQCFGDNTATLTASASGGSMATGYTYTWTGNATGQTLTNVGAGDYSVTITDGNGCTASANATVTGPTAALSASTTASSNVSCNGASDGSATVTANGG